MKAPRSALLVGLGILIGASVTALLFTTFNGTPSSTPGRESPENGEGTRGQRASNPEPPRQWDRDISGDCVLHGVVKNEDGSVANDAWVKLHLLDQPWSYPDPPLVARTDKEGKFQFPDMSDDIPFQVWAVTDDSAVASQKNVTCGHPVELILVEGSTLTLTFSGKNVLQHPITFQLAGGNLWPARQYTTKDGSPITIAGLSEGEYALWAESGDAAFITQTPIVLAQGDDLTVEVALEDSTPATVRVHQEGQGETSEDPFIVVKPTANGLLRKTLRVRSNEAAIQGLPPGRYTVEATADGSASPIIKTFGPGDEVTLRLERGAVARGIVKTASGDPVEGASIAVQQALGQAVVSLPSANGRRFGLRLVSAAAMGWPKMVALEDDVIVPGPERLPLPNLSSSQGAPTASWNPTSPDGRFLIDGLPSGRVSIWATHEDYVSVGKVDITITPGADIDDVIVVMKPGSALSVRIIDEREFPISEAEIQVYATSGERLGSAVTASDGYAQLKGLPATFRIEAQASERVPVIRRVENIAPGLSELVLKLMPADEVLSGRVLNPDGFGVAGAAITARSSGKNRAHVLVGVTEDDGTFDLEGAGEGRYHVTAQHHELGAARFAEAYHGDTIKLILQEGTPGPTGYPVVADNRGYGPTDSLGEIPIGGMNTPTVIVPDSQSGGVITTVETPYGQADQLTVTGPPPGKGGLPIKLGGGPGKVIVTHVATGSEVAAAGLNKGHRIVAIDDKKVTSPAAARKAISGKIGTIVMLRVSTTEGPLVIVVQRVRIRPS